MAIQTIGATTTQPGVGQALAGKTVTQDDFLKLLIAQLQNQDPLKPMDNQEFAAQLATFNSLGQLIEINGKLGQLQNTQGSASQYNAASLIGKEIETSGNVVSIAPGSSAQIGYQLGANAARVTVTVRNGAGELVRLLDAGNQTSGEQTLQWDGKDNAGKTAPAGLYSFEISAVDAGGKNVPASGLVRGTVTGVKLGASEPLLEVGALTVPLSAVTRVRSLG
jgi:flagellar basal-body rod modification protein FlgD